MVATPAAPAVAISAPEPVPGLMPELAMVEQELETLIRALTPEATAQGRGRPRVLPALALWAGLIVCVLRGWSSQRALWRLLTSQHLWHFPRVALSDQAIYRRLETTGGSPLAALFTRLSALLTERLAPMAATDLAPFASAVVALDETTLDPVARRLPVLRGNPAAARLPGKLAGVFDLRLQQWRTILPIPHPHQNEKVAARDLLDGLPAGSLILADLGYFGFQWFDDLTDRGCWWVSRLRAGTSTQILHTAYQHGDTFDGLVWLGVYRADRAKHAVRLVQFRQGQTLHRYVTNVTDPALLPIPEVARLYARRWDIELAVKLVKRELGLHLLWSSKPVVIEHQVWAVLILAQIFQALRVELAHRAGVDPFEISLPLMIAYLPQYAARGLDPIVAFLADAHALGFIRPSTRTVIRAPTIAPEQLIPPPLDLLRVRTPRYANRKSGPRSRTPAN